MLHRQAGGSRAAVEFRARHRMGIAAQHREFGVVHRCADAGGNAAGLPETRAERNGRRARNKTARAAKRYLGRMFIISLDQIIKVPELRESAVIRSNPQMPLKLQMDGCELTTSPWAEFPEVTVPLGDNKAQVLRFTRIRRGLRSVSARSGCGPARARARSRAISINF